VPNPLLTPEIAATVAGRAQFFFQVQQFQFDVLELEAYRGDVSPYFGEGVDILNEMIALKSRPFPARSLIRLDVGYPNSNLLEVDVDDLEVVKAAYISIWGDTNKPNVYPPW
jgi:hypothetical protein